MEKKIKNLIKMILLCSVMSVSILLAIDKSIEGWIILLCSFALIYLELKD